jgi:hypothetical protein
MMQNYNKKFKQGWSTISSISTKWKTNSHLKSLKIKQTIIYDVEIQVLTCDREAQKCSGVKLVKCSFREMRHCNRLCFYIDHYQIRNHEDTCDQMAKRQSSYMRGFLLWYSSQVLRIAEIYPRPREPSLNMGVWFIVCSLDILS